MLRKLVCDAQQVPTGMRVGKRSDAETVRRIQLPLEKLAADVLDFRQMQQARCRQQSLNVALLHGDVGRVAKVYQQLHGRFVNVSNRHLCLPTLRQFSREHSMEVRAARRQDHAVGKDLLLSDNENDVAQFSVLSQHVDGFQGVARVFVGSVPQASWRRRSLHGVAGLKAIHLCGCQAVLGWCVELEGGKVCESEDPVHCLVLKK